MWRFLESLIVRILLAVLNSPKLLGDTAEQGGRNPELRARLEEKLRKFKEKRDGV